MNYINNGQDTPKYDVKEGLTAVEALPHVISPNA